MILEWALRSGGKNPSLGKTDWSWKIWLPKWKHQWKMGLKNRIWWKTELGGAEDKLKAFTQNSNKKDNDIKNDERKWNVRKTNLGETNAVTETTL